MLSLDNAFDDAELRDFDRRARELAEAEALDYVGELKLDGVSMAVRYAGGRLDLALTRGGRRAGARSSRRTPARCGRCRFPFRRRRSPRPAYRTRSRCAARW